MKQLMHYVIGGTLAFALIAVAQDGASAQEKVQSKEKTQTQLKEQAQTKAAAQDQSALRNQARTKAAVQERTAGQGRAFVDADGDGICDNRANQAGAMFKNRMKKNGHRYGPGDGTGLKGIGPKDGTGYGPGPQGTGGTCDGTGPKGKTFRSGRR